MLSVERGFEGAGEYFWNPGAGCLFLRQPLSSLSLSVTGGTRQGAFHPVKEGVQLGG